MPGTLALFFGILVGILALFLNSKKSLYAIIGLSLIFNLYITVIGYGFWVHKLNFGTYTGVQSIPITNINLTSNGDVSKKLELPDQYYLLDFWTTSCGVCIRNFPETQKIMKRNNRIKTCQCFL